MDKIARFRQEIERRITDNTFGAKLELIDILAWLDTLSEEPDKSLEEAANKFAVFYDQGTCNGIAQDCFIAGAEWKEQQMPMPEDTVLFNKGVAEGRRLEREDMMHDALEGEAEELYNDGESQCTVSVGTYFKPGDKVYVLKAEED